MNNRHAKIWLSIFVFTLMAVGGAASFFASQDKTFFKGMEPLRDVVSASVLDAPTENIEQISAKFFKDEKESVPEIQITQTDSAATSTHSAIAAPCPAGEIPVIKNGKIESCGRKHKEKKPELPNPAIVIPAPLPPAPKVKILTEPDVTLQPITYGDLNPLPSSCESRGLFTYTGPDRPSLLYGMCIECGTNIFIMNGGKCA